MFTVNTPFQPRICCISGNSCLTAIAIRKKPKSLPNTSVGKAAITKPASTVVISAGIIIHHASSVRNSPFSACAGSTNAAIGRKAIKFVA